MNAHCERVIGSIRREVLDHVLIMNETHARRILAAYEQHYNEHRPTEPATNYRQAPTNSPVLADYLIRPAQSGCVLISELPGAEAGPGPWRA